MYFLGPPPPQGRQLLADPRPLAVKCRWLHKRALLVQQSPAAEGFQRIIEVMSHQLGTRSMALLDERHRAWGIAQNSQRVRNLKLRHTGGQQVAHLPSRFVLNFSDGPQGELRNIFLDVPLRHAQGIPAQIHEVPYRSQGR